MSATSLNSQYVSWTERNTVRQLKLVLPGAAVTYYLGTLHEFWRLEQGGKGFLARTAALGALGHLFATVVLFLYIILLPWIKGAEPNYRSWRESSVLSWVIPVLTTSIVVGWLLCLLTLGQWSNLGYVKGVIGVSGIYALGFGLLGLLPTPKSAGSKVARD